jgi:segregation and condensation protein B
MDSQQLKNIIEAAMLAAGGPLAIDQLRALFGEQNSPERAEIREALKELQDDYAERGIELREVASGFRIQVREEMGQWLAKLWEARPPRYSRALMETLAIVAYRQPVTRGDIEEIRGVSVTSNIIRTLLERDWIKVVGHRDVPGKPAMFGSTRGFLDYFGLKRLDDLPPLAELAAMEPVALQLQLGTADQQQVLTDEGLVAEGPSDQDTAEQVAGDAATAVIEDVADEIDPDAIDTVASEIDEDAEIAAAAEASGAHGDAATQAIEAEETSAELDEESFATAHDASPVSDALAAAQSDDGSDIDYADVAPGAVAPLVGLNAPDDELHEHESATVASLDDARAAAAQVTDAPGKEGLEDESAEVVPIKNS